MSKQTAQETIGQILADLHERDAIHIAMVSAVAKHRLAPGESVTVSSGCAVTTILDNAVGIVDPFLSVMVEAGQKFWILLKPNTITNLRHAWEHPAFPDESKLSSPVVPDEPSISKANAEVWLRDFARTHDVPGFDSMMEELEKHMLDLYNEDYITFQGRDAHCEIPPEFWTHYAAYIGAPVPEGKKAEFFSCSC